MGLSGMRPSVSSERQTSPIESAEALARRFHMAGALAQIQTVSITDSNRERICAVYGLLEGEIAPSVCQLRSVDDEVSEIATSLDLSISKSVEPVYIDDLYTYTAESSSNPIQRQAEVIGSEVVFNLGSGRIIAGRSGNLYRWGAEKVPAVWRQAALAEKGLQQPESGDLIQPGQQLLAQAHPSSETARGSSGRTQDRDAQSGLRPRAVSGDSESGEYEMLLAELRTEVAVHPNDIDARRALVDSYAMGARYADAIESLRGLTDRGEAEQGSDLRLAKLYSWSGDQDKALAILSEIQGHDPEVRELECQVLGSSGKAEKSADCYRNLVSSPEQAERPELWLALARNESWAGEKKDAVRAYRSYLDRQPEDREAMIELIRQLRFRGSYGQAIDQCDDLLQQNPDDAEVLAIKAEILHWARDRGFEARKLATRAAELDPVLPDAKVSKVYALRDLGRRGDAKDQFLTLEKQVEDDGGVTIHDSYGDAYNALREDLSRPTTVHATVPFSVYNDSDGIHDVSTGLEAAIPILEDHDLKLAFTRYRSSAPSGSVFTLANGIANMSSFSLGGSVRAGSGMRLTVKGGGTTTNLAESVRPTFEVGLSGSRWDRWHFDLSFGREFLAITPRAIDLGMSNYKASAGARYSFNSRTSVDVNFDRRFWSDSNRSSHVRTSLRRILRYSKGVMVDTGVQSRFETYERDTNLQAGFFTPTNLWRHEGFLGLFGEMNRRTTYEVRSAFGTQRVTAGAGYQPSWEVKSTVSVRAAGPFYVTGAYLRRNYSLVNRNGWYQAFFVGLRIGR